MKKIIYILLLAIASIQLTSCEVEFSPNADWKETPVVYCVLNQQDDTTWVRVQRCFLSEDNFHNHTQIADSTNYAEGTIDVKLLKWKGRKLANNLIVRDGNSPLDSLLFQYMLKPKQEGEFGYGMQPIYACRTKNQLDSNCVYQLVVLKTSTGDTLAKSETTLLGGNGTIREINGFRNGGKNFMLKFIGRGYCNYSWDTWSRSRLYQPRVRFYYKQDGELRYVDINCNEVINPGKSSILSSNIERGKYLADIEYALKDDRSPKQFVHRVDITLDACGEDLNAYIESIRAINNGSQNTTVYTNIENGIGVFSSRRSLTISVPSDSAVGPDTYLSALKDLNVGF